MTDGPPVTVVDPHGAPLGAPPAHPAWSRTERLLALSASLVLAVGVAAASDLASRPPAPYVRAVASEVTVGDPGSLLLDVVLDGRVPLGLQGHDLGTDEGWAVVMAPETLHRGAALVLAHDTICTGLRPPTVLRVGRLRLPVRDGARVLSCDPDDPLRVLSSSLTGGPRTVIELAVVNAATRRLHLTALRYAGFRFDGPLPLVLDGRDPDQPLRFGTLRTRVLRITVGVADCAASRVTLERAVHGERPEALPAVVDGKLVDLQVKGLEVYLDLLRRATCVR